MAKSNWKKPPPKPKPEIPVDLLRALAKRPKGSSSEDLLKGVIEAWGGTHRLALDLHQEFQKATPGGMTRQRILEMIQRLIITNTDRDLGQTKPPSQLGDDELRAALASFLSRANDAPASAG